MFGGVINVAMNIDNIDNGWDFLGYFGVGAAAGAFGGAVGNAVARTIGIGGFAGGAISGLAGGLSSGFVLGGGNSLVTSGSFEGFFQSAVTGALIGGVTGAVIGGVVGGYSAYKQGNNFWTGKPIDMPNWGQEVYTKDGAGDRNYMELSYDEFKPDPEKVVNEVMHSSQTPLGEGTNSVYLGYDKAGNVKYVGITERTPELRFTEHLNSGTERAFLHYKTIENARGLSRIQARIIEQRLINIYGMQKYNGALYNKINSIAPRYWNRYGIINK